jgi:phage repressor protein C with HTH and peptisase S24 domain
VTFESTVTDLLGRGIGVRFRAKGDSMHPTIRCGEHMHVEPVDPAAVTRGDVVLARHVRGLTAHRVVRIDDSRITTRGDNCCQDDPVIPADAIIGRVVGVPSRKVGRARGWVRRGLTFFSRQRQRLFAVA